jgi:hypothetical protein
MKISSGADLSAFGQLMKKIWAYHRLPDQESLKQTWKDDLSSFAVPELENAWNCWRKDPRNENKFISSVNILQLIRKNKNVLRETFHRDVLIRGVSFSTDILMDKLEAMEKNVPDLKKQMAAAKTPCEKILWGLVASGEKNALETALAKMLLNKTKT